MANKKWALLGILALIGILVACQPEAITVEKEVTRVVTKEKIVEKTVEITREITKIVTQIVTIEVAVTATPTSIPQNGYLNLTSFVDADIFNPLMWNDSMSADILGYMYDPPFDTDPWTGETIPGLVESWEITDGNKTVVYYVRQGPKWSDGEPITARDFKFMFDALMAVDDQGNRVLAESPHLGTVEYVETVELIDDYTLKVTYSEPICANFERMNLWWWPSHIFLSDPDFEWSDLADHEFSFEPTVFSGPFMLKEWVEGDHITLVKNPDYWKGAPHLDGITWRVVANQAAEREMIETGEVDIIDLDYKYLTEIEQIEHIDIFKFSRTAYVGICLQQGNPENPQPRLNEDGSVNEDHGMHPILGSKQVRQALTMATDRMSIINKVRMGQATPLHAHIVPAYGWAYNAELEPRGYDPEKAAAMLKEAGWVLEEGAEYRICRDCGTAQDGTPMKLKLQANAGNENRENTLVLIQQQWGEVGVEVEIETIEWNPYLDTLLGQAFDAIVVRIENLAPNNEEKLFDARDDVPSRGFNFCSFYRPEYEQMDLEAKTVKGCAYKDRGAIHRDIQALLYDEQPYIWLYTPRNITVVNKRIGGINPAPWSTTFNIHTWYIKDE